MLDTLTLSHSCGCSTVPKKNTELLKAKVRKAVRFENQTQARAQADCGLWHSWRDTEPAEVSCPLTSLPAIETWSHDLTSPPPSRGITTASLFHYLNPYYSAVQLYLHKKKIITIKEQLSDSTDALIFEGCILAAQCRTLLTLLSQVGPKGFLTQSSEEWENTSCFGGGWIQR